MIKLTKEAILDIIIEFSDQKQEFINHDNEKGELPEKVTLSYDALLAASQNIFSSIPNQ
jgi:hypothetical protein